MRLSTKGKGAATYESGTTARRFPPPWSVDEMTASNYRRFLNTLPLG
jgi:hypothetical protein